MPFVVLLFVWDFPNHDYWATALFAVAMATDWFDGRIARRRGRTSPLGSLLDPIADKILVLSVLIVLVDEGVFPGWMVAAIVAREFLVSGLRLAAIERGVVMEARDLGKLKTWSQASRPASAGSRPRALERRRRLVGAPRRARADVGLGARLRARRAGPAARPRRRVVEAGPARTRSARSAPSAQRLLARLRTADGPADDPQPGWGRLILSDAGEGVVPHVAGGFKWAGPAGSPSFG